jgi:hypothetical protein
MKTFLAILLAFAGLLAAIARSGFPLGLTSIFTSAIGALILGSFVAEYGRRPARPYDAPARRFAPAAPIARPSPRKRFVPFGTPDTLTG